MDSGTHTCIFYALAEGIDKRSRRRGIRRMQHFLTFATIIHYYYLLAPQSYFAEKVVVEVVKVTIIPHSFLLFSFMLM